MFYGHCFLFSLICFQKTHEMICPAVSLFASFSYKKLQHYLICFIAEVFIYFKLGESHIRRADNPSNIFYMVILLFQIEFFRIEFFTEKALASMSASTSIVPAVYLFISLLTLSQTTNFRLFQPERVSRQQFQIWWKWQKVPQKGRQHCGKRRYCLLWAFSPFPTVFFKDM